MTEHASDISILSKSDLHDGCNNEVESIDEQNLPEWMKKFNNMQLKEASVVSAQGRAPQGISRMRRGSPAMIERSKDIYNPMDELATSLPRETLKSPKKMDLHRLKFGTTDKPEATTDRVLTKNPKKLQTGATPDSSSEAITAQQTNSVGEEGDHKRSTTTLRSNYSEQVQIDNSKQENVMGKWGNTVKAKRPGPATTMSFRMIQNQAEKVRQRIAKAKESVQGDKPQRDRNGKDSDTESIPDINNGIEKTASHLDNSAAALFLGDGDTRTSMHESGSFDNSAAALFGFSGGDKSKNSSPKEKSVSKSKYGASMDLSMDLSAAAMFGFGAMDGSTTENFRSSDIASLDGGKLTKSGVSKGGSKDLSMDLSAAAMFGFGAMDTSTENIRSSEIASLDDGEVTRMGGAKEGSKDLSMDLSAAAMFGFGAMDGSTENLRSSQIASLDDVQATVKAVVKVGVNTSEEVNNSFSKESIKNSNKDEGPISAYASSTKRNSSLSDSESDDSSDDKQRTTALPLSKKKSFLNDSDSDDSSDDEKKPTQTAVKKTSFLNDSETDDSSVEKKGKNHVEVKKKSFSEDSESDDSSDDSSDNKNIKTQMVKKKSYSNDSESEDSSSDDENAKPRMTVKKKSFLNDSDEDDTSADEKAKTQVPLKQKPLLHDSDSDSGEENPRRSPLTSNSSKQNNVASEPEPSATITSISASRDTPAKTNVSPCSEHDSSSSDESQESKRPAAIGRKALEDDSSSSSETDSGSSSSTSSPRPKTSSVPTKDNESSDSSPESATKKKPILDDSSTSSGSSSSSTSSDTSVSRAPKRSALSEKEKCIKAPTRSVSIINLGSSDPQSEEIPDYENEKLRQDAEWQVALEALAAEEQAKKEKEEEHAWTAALENLAAEKLSKPKADDVWDTAMKDLVEFMKSDDDKRSTSRTNDSTLVPSETIEQQNKVNGDATKTTDTRVMICDSEKLVDRQDTLKNGPAKRMSWETSLDSSTHTAPPRKPTRQKSAKLSSNAPSQVTRNESTAKQAKTKKAEVMQTPKEPIATQPTKQPKSKKAEVIKDPFVSELKVKKSEVMGVRSRAAGDDPRIFAPAPIGPSPFAPLIVSRKKTQVVSVDNPFAPLGVSSHHTTSSLSDPFAPLNSSWRSALGDQSASSGRASKQDMRRNFSFSPPTKKLKSPIRLLSKASVSPRGTKKKSKKAKKSKKGDDAKQDDDSFGNVDFSSDSDDSTEDDRNDSKIKSKKTPRKPSVKRQEEEIESKGARKKKSTKHPEQDDQKNEKESKNATKRSHSKSAKSKKAEEPVLRRSGSVRTMEKDSKSGSRSKSAGRKSKGEDQIESLLERKSSSRIRSKSAERKKKKKDRG